MENSLRIGTRRAERRSSLIKKVASSRDAVSSESGLAQGLCVRGTETTVDGHGANVPVNAETPIDWASAMNKGEAAVAREFLDIRRNSVIF